MKKGCIISLGSVNVDFQARAGSRPEPGRTSTVEDFLLAGGGKAANVACLARRLGEQAMLIGRIGEDVLAPLALSPLQNLGVDVRFTRAVRGAHTGAAMILVGQDGEKTIALAPNANDAWAREDGEEAVQAVKLAPQGSVLVFDLEIPAEIVTRAMSEARQKGFRVVMDPSPAGRMEEGMLGGLDYLTPNPSEAETLTGIPVHEPGDGFRVGEELRSRGARNILVKLKDGGCAVTGEEERFLVEAEKVSPVDKTGAGDAFAGAFAVGVLRRVPLLEAARMAVVAASIAVTRYGSQAAYPDRRELEEWMERSAELHGAG